MSLPALRLPRSAPVLEKLDGEPVPEQALSLPVLVQRHSSAIWRALLRLGVAPDSVDDATQEVFIVAARRLDQIETGREVSFLYATAVRIAANQRRSRRTRREESFEEISATLAVTELMPDELLDQKRLRMLLERVLATMPDELREVFVLFELEQLSRSEIAPILGLPAGTVASRLRRSRELFEQLCTTQGFGGRL